MRILRAPPKLCDPSSLEIGCSAPATSASAVRETITCARTLQQDRAGNLGEKMVDTALVSDLIYLALENDRSWLIVVGQDADLVPGVLTAEGLLYGTDRRVIFLARGGIKNSNLKMTDLICHR